MGGFCQLCAVSFDIARYRTKDEPRPAGWRYHAAGEREFYHSRIENSFCFPQASKSGCETIFPSPNDGEGIEWHVAGQGCCSVAGYNGHRISALEMKDMMCARFVVLKPENAETPEDEEDYERDSKCIITARTTAPPINSQISSLSVPRYGVHYILPQDYRVLSPDGRETTWGIPFHDSCWQIFERVCRLRLGYVNLDGLHLLYERESCEERGFRFLKHDTVIQLCRKKFWKHIPGTEYLTANPVEIPDLELAVLSALETEPEGEIALYSKNSDSSPCDDGFSKLPEELRRLIISELSSRDIANVRLASRSFQNIRKAMLKQLIQKEMPWFWELDLVAETFQKRCDYFRCGDPTYADTGYDINWLGVWEHLKILKRSFKGLENRVRVWNLAEEVVGRINGMKVNEDGMTLGAILRRDVDQEPWRI